MKVICCLSVASPWYTLLDFDQVSTFKDIAGNEVHYLCCLEYIPSPMYIGYLIIMLSELTVGKKSICGIKPQQTLLESLPEDTGGILSICPPSLFIILSHSFLSCFLPVLPLTQWCTDHLLSSLWLLSHWHRSRSSSLLISSFIAYWHQSTGRLVCLRWSMWINKYGIQMAIPVWCVTWKKSDCSLWFSKF